MYLAYLFCTVESISYSTPPGLRTSQLVTNWSLRSLYTSRVYLGKAASQIKAVLGLSVSRTFLLWANSSLASCVNRDPKLLPIYSLQLTHAGPTMYCIQAPSSGRSAGNDRYFANKPLWDNVAKQWEAAEQSRVRAIANWCLAPPLRVKLF